MKAALITAALPGLLILLVITSAVVAWAWDSRLSNTRPPSTYEDEDVGED
jgi:hypothetical protein